MLHVAFDRDEHERSGDTVEITALPHFDISPNV